VDAENLFNPDRLDPQARQRLRKTCGIPETSLVVGFVGRIVRGKGIRELAAAWNMVRGQYANTVLLMIGKPEPVDPVPEEVLKGLREDPRVVMKTFVPKSEMPEHYAIMDLVAFPSRTEGLPNVPLEAAAMELPVVATRVTGCVDVVMDGVTGLLVPAGDHLALARALSGYIENPALRTTHGEAGRAMVRRDFRPEGIWEALYSQYRSHLEHRGFQLKSKGPG
jgi:glycosyltransferase involved in cell wall biosynthesis